MAIATVEEKARRWVSKRYGPRRNVLSYTAESLRIAFAAGYRCAKRDAKNKRAKEKGRE